MTQDLGVVLYDRQRKNVRVTAYQGPAKIVTVPQGEGCAPKEVKQHEYRVIGIVDGAEVKNELVEGYRQTQPAARTMFKSLCDEHCPSVHTAKQPKIQLTKTKVAELLKNAEARHAKTGELIEKYSKMLAEMPDDEPVNDVAVDEAGVPTMEASDEGKKKGKKHKDEAVEAEAEVPADMQASPAFTPSGI